MAGILNRIRSFLRSPRGQRLTVRGRQLARDPRTRRRAQEMWRRRGR